MLRLVLFTIFALITASSKAADNTILVSGDEVTIVGKFVLAKGEDINERLVSYQAINLDKPIDIKADGYVFENVKYLKVRFDNLPPNTFSKYRNLRLKLTGTIIYNYFGLGAFINPAKFEVTNVERLQ